MRYNVELLLYVHFLRSPHWSYFLTCLPLSDALAAQQRAEYISGIPCRLVEYV